MNSKEQEFLLFHKFSIKQEAIVAAILLLLLIILRARAFFNISEGYLGGYEYDAGLYVWLMKSNLRDFLSEPWFDTKAFHPYGKSLAWSDNFILPSYIAGFFQLIGFSLASSYNLVLLGTSFLNAYLTYLCCFYLRGLRLVAVVPAVFMLCYSFLTAHLGHPQLQFLFFFPLLILAFFRFLKTPSWPNSLLITLPITLAFLCSAYISIFLALSLLVLTGGVSLLRPKIWSKEFAIIYLSGCFISLLPVVPFVLPYLEVQSSFGTRGLYEPQSFALSALSFVSAPNLSLLYFWLSPLSHPEAQIFPGLAILALTGFSVWRVADVAPFLKRLKPVAFALLAVLLLSILSSFHWTINYPLSLALWSLPVLLGLFLRYLGKSEELAGANYFTNRSFIALFLFLACIFFVLGFGPLTQSGDKLGALTPFTILYYTVPGVSAVRAIGRFAIPLFFFLALAINFGLPHVMRRHPKGKFLPYLLVLLVLLENYQVAYPFEGITQRPTAFSKLDKEASPSDAVIALPFTKELKDNGQVRYWSDFSKRNVNYMHWNFPSNSYLVNGYSGMRSWLMLNFPRKMSGFPDERSLATLRQIPNLKHIIVMPEHGALEQLEKNYLNYSELSNFQSYGDSVKISFSPENEIKNKTDFLLRVPSKTRGTIYLQFKTQQESKNPVNVRVFIDKYFEHDPYTELSVPADTNWHDLGFKLPVTSESVIPYIVRFEAQEGNKVFLGSREYRSQ